MNLLQMLSFGETGWGMALLKAAGTTLLLTLAALLIGALIGGVIAAAKLSRRRIFFLQLQDLDHFWFSPHWRGTTDSKVSRQLHVPLGNFICTL